MKINTLKQLVGYNTLLKYYIKANEEGLFGEKKINISFNNMSNIENISSDIHEILGQVDYDNNFILDVNCLYQLSQSNSDLVALNGPILKQLYIDYPVSKELEQLSFGIFEFLNNEVFEAWDEYERPIIYKGFDDIQTDFPEYWFKDDTFILWDTYYLLNSIVEAQVKQKHRDIDNQKEFLLQEDISKYIQQQKKSLIEEITLLSSGFCDRNFVFSCLREDKQIEKDYLTGYILSEVLATLNTENYAQYIELDYSHYPTNYSWQFEKKTLKDYPDLLFLPDFERLINLLTNIIVVNELEVINKKEYFVADNTENTILPKEEKVKPTIDIEEKEKASLEKECPLLQEAIDPLKMEIAPSKKTTPAEYILSVPILNLIYQEFNEELWNDITLAEFLNIFTTTIIKQDNFRLKHKQTARFYYLLKKIWINSSNKSLFDTEKEWIIPFLQNYGLSYSAYTNQFIKNEGGKKHLEFTRSVDKILPKDEI